MIKKIASILLIVLGVLMILGGAFACCWSQLAFLVPFFGACIAVGAILTISIAFFAGFNWEYW